MISVDLTLRSAPTLATFAATAIVLGAIPGPNMLVILARGADQGPRAAFAAAIGQVWHSGIRSRTALGYPPYS